MPRDDDRNKKHFKVYKLDVIDPSFEKGFSLRRKMDFHRFKANGIHRKTFYAAAAVAWNKFQFTAKSSKHKALTQGYTGEPLERPSIQI